MLIRRVTTSRNSNGKSYFATDERLQAVSFKHVPGFAKTLVWRTPPQLSVHQPIEDPTFGVAKSLIPAPGSTTLLLVTFPPDSVMAGADFDPAAAGAEYRELLPGIAETFEADNPGMHTTDTVDYAIVLDGSIDLELDDGVIRTFHAHDVVVQNGTRHAWRNRSGTSATVIFVLIGATRNF